MNLTNLGISFASNMFYSETPKPGWGFFVYVRYMHILHTIKKEAGNGTKRKTKGWLTF